MSMRAVASWVVGVALVAAGCGVGPPSASWPTDAGRDLVPTQALLVGGTAAGGVVADGAGMLWVDGPDLVARVDPSDGAATVWDAADDLAFAAVRRLHPAQPAGVWIDTGDRVLLFSGQRFVVDIALPRQYARDVADMPRGEVLQVGAELWASGAAGVGRWVDGAWSAVGLGSLAAAGPLALDSEGGVWAGAILDADGQPGAAVRFDGTDWVTPGDPDTGPHGVIEDIAADPAGGVWVASSGVAGQDAGIFRYDGATWRNVGPGGLIRDLSVTSDGEVWAMASAGSGIDPAGESTVARLGPDGTWQSYSAADGAPQSGEFTSASLGAAGEAVAVSHDGGLVLWDGERFVDLWDDPAAVVRARYDVGPDGLLAVSADEVWVPAEDLAGTPASGLVSSLDRWRDGAWESVLVGERGQTVSSPVLASDGAVWAVTPEGLVRIAEGAAEVLDDRIAGYGPCSLAAGADAGVWAIREGSVVRVDADGRATDIGRPPGTTRVWEAAPLAASVGGTGQGVWVALPTDRHGTARLAHWDGDWTLVDVPVDEGYVTQLLVAADGSVWLVLDSPDRGLARLAGGSWSFDPGTATGLAAAPDGSVCSLRADGVQCYDASLSLVRTIPVAVGDGPSALGIAPDGAVWVLGEQVSRVAGGA